MTGRIPLASGLLLSVLPLSVEAYRKKNSFFLRAVRREAIAAA